MPNYEKKPRLKKYRFTTDRSEPLTAKLTLRITESMNEKIKAIPNHPELIRVLLQEWLNTREGDDTRI